MRRELEIALTSGIAVVVVLVGAAAPPTAGEFPDSLRPLAQIQTVRMADEDWEYDLGRLIQALERHGLFPTPDDGSFSAVDKTPALVGARRYERTFAASRRRALDAVIGSVEGLNYKQRKVHPEAANVTFRVARRDVTVKIVDSATAGHSAVVVEFVSVKTGALVAGTIALGFATGGAGIIAGPALRLWERNFAKGFLNNVDAVLEGRGVIEDSALPPGVANWRKRNRQI